MAEAQIPVPSVPLVDPRTGNVSREWRWFFHDLWQRSGGSGDITGLFTTDIGSAVQAWDAGLDDLAGLAVTDGNFIVGDGTNWIVEIGATARASLGLTIGSDVQAWDAQLDDIAALAITDSNFIVGDGSNWVAESGSTARDSLSMGASDNVIFAQLTINAIEAGDASLGINGIDAAQGGAIPLTGGTSSTSGNAGGAVSMVGGVPGATGVGGAVSLTGAAGGATSGAGGDVNITGGAGTAGNSLGGDVNIDGGDGSGTQEGGDITINCGDGGATGHGGDCPITAGSATGLNKSGGTVDLLGGQSGTGAGTGGHITLAGGDNGGSGEGGKIRLLAGTGGTGKAGGSITINAGLDGGGGGGQVHLRSDSNTPVLTKRAVASTGTDAVTLTVAELFNGIMVQTPTVATTLTTPTGAAISAALDEDLTIGDSFQFSVINLGGAGDIITFTAGASGVTITGQATIDDAGADITSSGTFTFVNTAANTWIAYRVS